MSWNLSHPSQVQRKTRFCRGCCKTVEMQATHTHEQWLFLKHMISRTMTVLFSAAYKDGRIISSMRRYQCVLDKEAIWHRILPFSAQSEGSCWKGSCWTSKCTLLKTLFTLPCRISMTEVWKRNKRHRHAALSTGARITALSLYWRGLSVRLHKDIFLCVTGRLAAFGIRKKNWIQRERTPLINDLNASQNK